MGDRIAVDLNDCFEHCWLSEIYLLYVYICIKDLSSQRETQSFHFSNIVTPFPSSYKENMTP